jgi:hypothetical protein
MLQHKADKTATPAKPFSALMQHPIIILFLAVNAVPFFAASIS